jgi:hypothetical protein
MTFPQGLLNTSMFSGINLSSFLPSFFPSFLPSYLSFFLSIYHSFFKAEKGGLLHGLGHAIERARVNT